MPVDETRNCTRVGTVGSALASFDAALCEAGMGNLNLLPHTPPRFQVQGRS
jgi:pyruvoyl-dependent arginine decarboxylase (PvlArgDC)